jgi:ribosomal protein L40E
MYEILLILGTGIPTGVLLAVLHQKFSDADAENLDNIGVGRNNDTQNRFSEDTYNNRDKPISWDGESQLSLCGSCGTLNEHYSMYCRKCTGNLNMSRKLDKKKIEAKDETNGH